MDLEFCKLLLHFDATKACDGRRSGIDSPQNRRTKTLAAQKVAVSPIEFGLALNYNFNQFGATGEIFGSVRDSVGLCGGAS